MEGAGWLSWWGGGSGELHVRRHVGTQADGPASREAPPVHLACWRRQSKSGFLHSGQGLSVRFGVGKVGPRAAMGRSSCGLWRKMGQSGGHRAQG